MTERSRATVVKESVPFARKEAGLVTVTSISTVWPGSGISAVTVGQSVASGVAPVTDHENDRPDWSPNTDRLVTPKVSDVSATNDG